MNINQVLDSDCNATASDASKAYSKVYRDCWDNILERNGQYQNNETFSKYSDKKLNLQKGNQSRLTEFV